MLNYIQSRRDSVWGFFEAWIQSGEVEKDERLDIFQGAESVYQEEKSSDALYEYRDKLFVRFECVGFECMWLNDEEIWIGGHILGVESAIECLAPFFEF